MEHISLSLVLDGIIVILLIATIIYAARLSLYLKKFKESREDLEGIIKNLSTHIDKAEGAVQTLNESVEDASEDLQRRMNKANAMFDELDIVVQSGDSLANRLEELAVRNRKILDGGEGDIDDLVKVTGGSEYEERLENIVKKVEEQRSDKQVSPSPFMIRDTELEKDGIVDEGFTLEDNEVLSDAERDLYDTIQKKKKSRGQK